MWTFMLMLSCVHTVCLHILCVYRYTCMCECNIGLAVVCIWTLFDCVCKNMHVVCFYRNASCLPNSVLLCFSVSNFIMLSYTCPWLKFMRMHVKYIVLCTIYLYRFLTQVTGQTLCCMYFLTYFRSIVYVSKVYRTGLLQHTDDCRLAVSRFVSMTMCFRVCGDMTHQVSLAGCMVLLCSHSNQSVIVKENAKRVAGSDKDVDAQIELVALHQEGLVQVLLNDKVLLGWQLLTVTDKRDPG